jgi:hypothetical protein
MIISCGPGHGKSTWCARLLENPPSNHSVDVIVGDDLSSRDETLASTLSRILMARPMLGISSRDFTDTVWEWLFLAPRLVSIDGLDRVPAEARQGLANWIIRTVRASDNHDIKFVLTTRPGFWSSLGPHLLGIADSIYAATRRQTEAGASIEPVRMDVLDDKDVLNFYAACGLPPSTHLRRPLRTPALIVNYARLRERFDKNAPLTRYHIFSARLQEAITEIEHRSGIGQVRSAIVLRRLGQLLADTSDGRVDVSSLAGPSDAEVIDELVRADILSLSGTTVRPEQDEILELLWGSQLELSSAWREFESGRTDPLFLGAIAMAAAKHESDNDNAISRFLNDLMSNATDQNSIYFALAAQIINELSEHKSVKSQIASLFVTWDASNFSLMTSNLHELILNLNLDPVERMELLLNLVEGEDEYDWKERYWLESPAGRIVTEMAAAATRAAREAGTGAIELLSGMIERGGKSALIGMGLNFEAALYQPAEFLEAVWNQNRLCRQFVFDRLSIRYPLEVLILVGRLVHQERLGAKDAVAHVWDVASKLRHVYTSQAIIGSRESALVELNQLGKELLIKIDDPELRGKLSVCCLEYEEVAEFQNELADLQDYLQMDVLWRAITVAGEQRIQMLRKVINDATILDQVGVAMLTSEDDGTIPLRIWTQVAQMLLQSIDEDGKEMELASAHAVEALLRRTELKGNFESFWPLARRLASSVEADARKPLIFLQGLLSEPRFPQKRRNPASKTVRDCLVS